MDHHQSNGYSHEPERREDGSSRREGDSGSATSPNGSGNGSNDMTKRRKGPPADGRRHLSCENCRIRKMRCSRTSPCLSCKMRGDECVWVGAAPNGNANEDEVEQTQMEVNRLKKLVDILLTRLEQQDEQIERQFPNNPALPPPPPPLVPSKRGPPPSNQSSSTRPYDPRHPYPDPPLHMNGRQRGPNPVPSSSSSWDVDIVVPSGSSRGGAGGGGANPASGRDYLVDSSISTAGYQSQYR
ncbi:Zn(II)2Cys6 transcription factor domain-containing protein [Sporobolomyces salmoneus]|uniref:Zn(II)2Cys6 transcription factor domain-containing protein n=1 Tax=Sporobolomyces salmoneus TaxID=183962 RepID=UPI0031737681